MIKCGRRLILFLTLLGLATGAAFAQEVKIPGVEGSIGDILSVPVTVTSTTGKGIISFEMHLQYDPAVLVATGATVEGTVAGNSGWPEPTVNTAFPGEVYVAAIGATALSGSGDLIYINFEVLGGGATTSPLKIADFVFNENIYPTRVSGLFQYRGAAGVLAKVASNKVDVGDTVMVPVLVDNVSNRNIRAYQFDLKYQPSALTALDFSIAGTVTGEAGWGLPVVNFNTPGTISVAAAGANPLVGGGHLIRFRFVVSGASTLELSGFLFNEGIPAVETRSGGLGLRPVGAIPVTLPNIAGEPNTSVTIPVTVGAPLDDQEIVSYEFGIKFDPNILIPKGVTTKGTLSEKWGLATFNLNLPGEVRIAHAGKEPLAGKGRLITLFFEIPVNATGLTFIEFVDFAFNEGTPEAVTDDGSLSLAGDVIPPAILSGPTLPFVGARKVQIKWLTDEPATSIVVYGPARLFDAAGVPLAGKSDSLKKKIIPELVKDHTVLLENLTPQTKYFYRIGSADAFSNMTPALPYTSFTTKSLTEVDSTPPIIIGNEARVEGIQQTAANVLWDTDESSNSILRYWTAAKDTTNKTDLKYVTAHSIALSGLTGGVTYRFQVASEDVSANRSSWTAVDSFKTDLTGDTTPPTVSSVTVANITDTKALITWNSSEKADSYVEYGTTTEYAKKSPISKDYVKAHTVLLTGLTLGTTYHFRVASTDIAGNGPTFSDDKTFTTMSVADRTPPAISSGPVDQGVSDKSATIVWTTNELSTSVVKYGKVNLAFTDSVAVFSYVSDHSVLLAGLEPGTVYYYIVESTDLSGNKQSVKPLVELGLVEYSLKTKAQGDVLPPLITTGPIANGITNTTATIVWMTDEMANATVEYGTSTAYDKKVTEAKIETIHKVRLTELLASTTYHYRVSSTDMAGNKVLTDIDYTFKTKTSEDTKAPVIISGPVTKGVSDTTAVIVWTTNEPANTFAEFGETAALGQLWGFAESVTDHKINLTGLKALTTYYYAVNSTDAAGNKMDTKNISPSGDYVFSFKTKALTDKAAPVVVAGPLVTGRTDKTAQVRWLTDELADSYVLFGASTEETAWGSQGTSEPVIDHQVILTNLTGATEYHYKVKSTDLSLNSATTEVAQSFVTKLEADVTAPVILSGPILLAKSDIAAVIKWETDELSWGKVEIGPDENYGDEIVDAVYRYIHYITITDLERATNYFYRVTSTDPSGNSVSDPPLTRPLTRALQPPGGGGSFTTSTEADTRSPLIIAGPTVVARTNSAVTFEWQTDEVADSKVDYGESTDYESFFQDGTDVKKHRVTLTNLAASTTYNYRVASIDPSNNPGTVSANAVVTTEAEADVTAPTITSGPSILAKTNNRATIYWKTNEPATSRIDFGKTISYGDYKEDIDFVNEHKVTVTNLSASTVYHIKATTKDVSGNKTASADVTFTTEAAADVTAPTLVGTVTKGAVGSETAEIMWKTNEISDSFIFYGTNQASLTLEAGDEEDVTDHKLTLSELTVGTVYYFRVGSIDPSGNAAETLATGSFTTLASADVTPPAAPEKLLAKPRNASVILVWNANAESDFAGYNIQRAAGAAGSFSAIATLVTDTTYTNTGLTNGTLYRYKITASDKFGNVSSASSEASATPATKLPPDPFDLVSPVDGATISAAQVTFVWQSTTDPNPGETVAYNLTYAPNSDFSGSTVVSGLTATTTSISLASDQYWWKVVAVGSDAEQKTSTQTTWSFTFTSNVELANFTAQASQSGAVLQWITSREEGLRGFRVLRSDSETGEYALITPPDKLITAGRESYKYIDRTAEVGFTYYYKLEALSLDGGSGSFGPLALDMVSILPRQFAMSQNYPNPFNPETSIRYALPVASVVDLVIYDIVGHQVRRLVSGRIEAGFHQVRWDGRDDRGGEVPSGVYFYRIQAMDTADAENSFRSIKKMVVIK